MQQNSPTWLAFFFFPRWQITSNQACLLTLIFCPERTSHSACFSLQVYWREDKEQLFTVWVRLPMSPTSLESQSPEAESGFVGSTSTWSVAKAKVREVEGWPGVKSTLGKNVTHLGSDTDLPRFTHLRETQSKWGLPRSPPDLWFPSQHWGRDVKWTYICLVFLRVNSPPFSDPNKWVRAGGHLLPLLLPKSSKICPNNCSGTCLCQLREAALGWGLQPNEQLW